MHDLVTEYKLHLEVKDLMTTVKYYPKQGCAYWVCDRNPAHCFYLEISLEKIIYANNILQMVREMPWRNKSIEFIIPTKGITQGTKSSSYFALYNHK